MAFNFNRRISAGVHTYRITQCEEKTANDGKVYMQMTAVVEENGPDKDMELGFRVYMTPAAIWRFHQLLDAVGAPTEGKGEAGYFVGKKFKANTKHVPGKDNDGNEVIRVDLERFMKIGGAVASSPVSGVPGGTVARPRPNPMSANASAPASAPKTTDGKPTTP